MKGQIPVTEKLILESDESQWRLLTRGIINELRTSALIERSPENRVRIQLIIETILPPEQNTYTHSCMVQSSKGPNICNGLARTNEFFDSMLSKKMWIFAGYIDGEQKTPIVITHYELFNVSIYTQKLVSESIEAFQPFAHLN